MLPVQAMYHLQRGPLLDPRFCHADERALLHACFIAAPAEHAAPMLLPALHLLNQATGYFEAAAPANLALLPGAHATAPLACQIPLWWLCNSTQIAHSAGYGRMITLRCTAVPQGGPEAVQRRQEWALM